MPRDDDWRDLMAALDLKGPIEEYKILNLAAKRIRDLEQRVKDTDNYCINIATGVLPTTHMYFAQDAVLSLVAEVKRLQAATMARQILDRFDDIVGHDDV